MLQPVRLLKPFLPYQMQALTGRLSSCDWNNILRMAVTAAVTVPVTSTPTAAATGTAITTATPSVTGPPSTTVTTTDCKCFQRRQIVSCPLCLPEAEAKARREEEEKPIHQRDRLSY